VLLTFFYTLGSSGWSSRDKAFNTTSANLLFWFLIIIIGLRPLSWVFGDMGTYAHYFHDMQIDGQITSSGDWGFYILMLVLSKLVSVQLFFLILVVLYIYTLYKACKRLFPNYYYYAFLFLVSSFSFFTYGTNGLRNGLATSFFILGLSYANSRVLRWFWFLLAWSFHSSLVLPIGAYILASIYQNTKVYLSFWLLSIFMSLAMGSFWENLFMRFGLNFSNRVGDYFTEKDLYQDSFSSTGFRWDFLLYSALPIYVAYYFIFKRDFRDKFYTKLVNMYLITNVVWILVIRASFTNRFAYLSWFMMGLVIVYPFLKKVYWKDQYMRMGLVLVLYYSFTYFMNVIVY